MPPKTGTLDINDQFVYTIGTNAIENWRILSDAQILSNRRDSDSSYFWFHVDSHSSAYVILKTPLDTILTDSECRKIVYETALLCKQHSKVKHETKPIKVVYCSVDNIRRGSTVGEAVIKSTSKCKYVSV